MLNGTATLLQKDIHAKGLLKGLPDSYSSLRANFQIGVKKEKTSMESKIWVRYQSSTTSKHFRVHFLEKKVPLE